MTVASLMPSPVLRAALADPLLGPDLLKLDAASVTLHPVHHDHQAGILGILERSELEMHDLEIS